MKNNWKTFRIEDVVTKLGDGLHGTPKYDDKGEYFFINGNNLVDGKIVIKESTKRVSVDEFKKYKKELNDRTILLGINGTIGNVALYNNEKCILGKSACYLNVINTVDKNFIKYVITGDGFQSYIKNTATGTTIKNVSLKSVREFEFLLPDLKTQKEISSILVSLDYKIELNNQMNQTLETIARTIFKEWFINFKFPGFDGVMEEGLPKGWKKIPIDESIVFLNGLALQKFPPKSPTDFLPVIKIRELRQGLTDSSDKASSDIPKQYIINNGDILFSWSGSLEVVIWCEGKGALNQHLFKVSSSIFPKWFYYLWTKHFLPSFQATAESKATTMGHIQRKHLTESLINIPSEDIMKLADAVFSPLIERIISTKIENQTLTQLRDSLLPKLMTGKIKVQE